MSGSFSSAAKDGCWISLDQFRKNKARDSLARPEQLLLPTIILVRSLIELWGEGWDEGQIILIVGQSIREAFACVKLK